MNIKIPGGVFTVPIEFHDDYMKKGREENESTYYYSKMSQVQMFGNGSFFFNYEGVKDRICVNYNKKKDQKKVVEALTKIEPLLPTSIKDLDKLRKKHEQIEEDKAEDKHLEDLYSQCLGDGFNKKWALKHLAVLSNALNDDEAIELLFMGIYNFDMGSDNREYDSSHEADASGFCAFAITDKRIIIAQEKVIGDYRKSIYLGNINDITVANQAMDHLVIFDTMKERFSANFGSKSIADTVSSKAHEILEKYANANVKAAVSEKPAASPLDEIKKLKELLDMGAITQEEFDAKKKQLLGL